MSSLRNTCFFAIGIIFLAIAKLKHQWRGYTSSKPFDYLEIQRCIEYNQRVVSQWLTHLREYTANEDPLKGKQVLELGPGSDLGIGLMLLASGCAGYSACDVNSLAAAVPERFYTELFAWLRREDPQTDTAFLRRQLARSQSKQPSQLNYVVQDDFDLVAALGESSIDIVFSQAAFEHFDDVEATVAQLTKVCKPGARLVIEIDLKTHSRWIRSVDPNNIYRYPDSMYSAFYFRGIPNRMRPYQYVCAFERYGWRDIRLVPISRIEPGGDRTSSYSGMNRQFLDQKNQMDYLSIVICAYKAMPSSSQQSECLSK